jgi:hypothetical protein
MRSDKARVSRHQNNAVKPLAKTPSANNNNHAPVGGAGLASKDRRNRAPGNSAPNSAPGKEAPEASTSAAGGQSDRPPVPEFAQLRPCADDSANPVMARAIAEAGQVANGESANGGAGERWELASLQALRSGLSRRRKAAHARLEGFQKVRDQLEDWHGHVSLCDIPVIRP